MQLSAFHPLESIDEVDWDTLEDVYGPATDLPGYLRGLLSTDAEERRDALNYLHGSVYYESARYSATLCAVPILIDIVADPRVHDRAPILELLSRLAVVDEREVLGRGVPLRAWRSCHANLILLGLDGFVAEKKALEGSRERAKKTDYTSLYEIALNRMRCYRAVQSGIPIFCELLDDEDTEPDVKIGVTKLLAWFPADKDTIIPHIFRVLSSIQAPALHAAAIVTIGLLHAISELEETTVERLQQSLQLADRIRTWAAATALASMGVYDEEAIKVLAYAIYNPPPQPDPPVPFLSGDISAHACACLASIPPNTIIPPEAVSAILAALPHATLDAAIDTLTVVFRMTLQDGEALNPLPAVTKLSSLQLEVLEVVASVDVSVWERPDLVQLLRKYHLPEDVRAFRQWVGCSQDPDTPMSMED